MRLLLLTLAAFALVDQQRPRIRYGPGVCGPIDPSYVRLATATGGQPFPMSPTELVKLAQHVTEVSGGDSVTLLWAGGTAADQTTFTIPIDSSVRRVMFTTTFDGTGGQVAISGPNGALVQPHAGVEDTPLNCGRILNIDSPAAGGWQVTVEPSERFWLVVHGRSEIDVLSADFVRAGGRPGHEGMFPIEGEPIAGRPATLRVRLTEPVKAPQFALLSRQGQPIARIALAAIDDDEFAGAITLPAEAFRVAVTSVDSGGAPLQRVLPRTFQPEQIEVLADAAQAAPAGREIAIPFTIRNLGPAGRFRNTSVAEGQRVTRVEPELVEIGSGEDSRVTVLLPAAAESDIGKEFEVRLVASRENSEHYNSGVQRVTIVKN